MRGKEVACPEGMASLLFAKWATLTDVPFRISVDVWSAGIKKGLGWRRQALPPSTREAPRVVRRHRQRHQPLGAPACPASRACPAGPAAGHALLVSRFLPMGYHGCASLSVPSFAPALLVVSTPRLVLLYSTPSIALTSPGLLCCLLYFVFSSSSPPFIFLLAVAARCSAPLALVVACCYRAVFLFLFSIPLSPLPPPPSLPAP